jgi:hypothetical protein
MMDCKKALVETDGDIDKAIDILREKGLASAAKKASRVAAEGIVATCADDKAGVLVENGVYACGVPFCGTSGICHNKTFPLGAIVLLSQSKTNSIRRLAGVEALRGIMQNIYLDLIAPNEQKTVVDLLIELLKTVPVYSLSCTADENAVIILENELRSGGVI